MERRRGAPGGPRVGLARVLRGRRALAILATLVTVGAVLTVTQVADASSRRRAAARACASATATTPQPTSTSTSTGTPSPNASTGADPAAGGVPDPGQTEGNVSGGQQNGRQVQHHVGDGQDSTWRRPNPQCPTPAPTSSTGATGGAGAILGNDCSKSDLQPHTGFQDGNRCVSTEFGEVGSADKNPTLLITRFPQRVRVGQAFTIQVSTRNLVRDRFLAAGQGGYYKESSFLTDEGLVRGHFHTACRMLSTTTGAPDPAPVPAFFVATEDGGGGTNPDVITINVSGMPAAGIAQCAAWAGDGSHRIPMMQRANQIPAFDSVRIVVG